MKTYNLTSYGRTRPISLTISKYTENNNLAIFMTSYEEGYPEPWSNLTVNLSEKLPLDFAYVDTNNNGQEILKWIEDNKLGKFTGVMKRSGYCTYPLYTFNLKQIEEE